MNHLYKPNLVDEIISTIYQNYTLALNYSIGGILLFNNHIYRRRSSEPFQT